MFFSQVFKGALFRTATEQKEQTRYFSKSVLFMIPFRVIVCSVSYQIFTAILLVASGDSRAFQFATARF
jgi:hypothetical protein